ALTYYRSWWKDHPHPEFVALQSIAYSQAYLATREPAYGNFVFEMNDWQCSLQYASTDARHPSWVGGFKGFAEGKVVPTAPKASCAAFASGLVDACLLTRQVPDAARNERYKNA